MKLGEKVLEKAVEIALVAVFFNLELLRTKRKDWRKLEINVQDDLIELNYDRIKRSILYLQKKGLIQSAKEKYFLPKITEEGKKRLSLILPKYDEKRVWDGRVYLITYDLPVNKNKERNCLRTFLRKIGSGMLQKSVWITPYNPSKIMEQFAKEKDINDLILISSLGKDGTVGEIDLIDLFVEVYKLRELNEKYKEFIFKAKNNKARREETIFHYLNILGKDPQLPFPLLPEWWVGDKAYKYFFKITH